MNWELQNMKWEMVLFFKGLSASTSVKFFSMFILCPSTVFTCPSTAPGILLLTVLTVNTANLIFRSAAQNQKQLPLASAGIQHLWKSGTPVFQLEELILFYKMLWIYNLKNFQSM